jgi:hypothetical protein
VWYRPVRLRLGEALSSESASGKPVLRSKFAFAFVLCFLGDLLLRLHLALLLVRRAAGGVNRRGGGGGGEGEAPTAMRICEVGFWALFSVLLIGLV